MISLILLSTWLATLPSTYSNGTPLPDTPLVILIYNADTDTVITGDIGLPGERVKVWGPDVVGRFYAKAKIIETQAESVATGVVVKVKAKPGCYGSFCHE